MGKLDEDASNLLNSATTPESARGQWTREEIQRFLALEQPQYQRIELPFGLRTEGDDRSAMLDHILPRDLHGQSVIDIGCFLGYFCLEASRRGAARVVGADVDRDRLRQARHIADILDASVEYRLFDVERDALEAPFDHVLFLNVLHHVRYPIMTLDRLIAWTRERLVLEVAGPASPRPKKLLTSMGAGPWMRWRINALPLIVVGRNGSTSRQREQKFFFSAKAMEHLLMHQRGHFARIDAIPSPHKNRFLLIAHKRRVKHLAVVAGVTAVGKSTFIEHVLQGRTDTVVDGGIDPHEGWDVLEALRFRTYTRQSTERLIYHYDLLGTWLRHVRLFHHDDRLDMLQCAERVIVVTLVARPSVLRQRIEARLGGAAPLSNRKRQRLRKVLNLYGQPEQLAQVIRDWTAFCSGFAETIFFDTSDATPRRLDPQQWESVILGDR